MLIYDLPQVLVYGMVLGSVLALGAMGVSLLFGILRFAHFAHGDVMSAGAYCALAGISLLGLPLWGAFPLALIGGAVIAATIDRLVYRRLRRTQPVILLIASIGVALILRSAAQLIWGPNNQVYRQAIQMPWRIGDIALRPDHLAIITAALILMALLAAFLRFTRMGKAMRAVADDPDLARVTGIDTERVILWTWILGGGLAGAAGFFLALDTRLHPLVGWNILLPVFAAAIVGGIGKVQGALAGGLIIGLAMEVSSLFIPTEYKPAVAFSLLVITLLVRPTGLFRGR